jgi:hypothetical protein
MKNLLYILLLILTGCNHCLLSQTIPDKYIIVGTNCTAVLPDYRIWFKVTGNCIPASLTQLPSPGVNLSVNQTAKVTIRATNASGKFSERSFNVTAIDTIKPTLKVDTAFIRSSWQIVDDMYNRADLELFKMLRHDMIIPGDFPYVPKAVWYGGIYGYISGVERVRYTKDMPSWSGDIYGHGSIVITKDGVITVDTTFEDRKTLFIEVDAGHAKHLIGNRRYTFK